MSVATLPSVMPIDVASGSLAVTAMVMAPSVNATDVPDAETLAAAAVVTPPSVIAIDVASGLDAVTDTVTPPRPNAIEPLLALVAVIALVTAPSVMPIDV